MKFAVVWILGAATLVLLSCATALTLYERSDETWFLRVLHRVNSGETLYSEVYYPLLPLAIYVGAAVTSVFGPHFLVLQALLFTCFIATVWVCDSIARHLEVRPIARALLLLALCVWSSPMAVNHSTSLYQPLSMLLLLLCLRAVLAWSPQATEGRSVLVMLAAMAAGAGFATKDQTGALTLVALLVSVAIVAVHRGFPVARLLRTSLAIVAVFIVTVLVTVVPVMVSGAFEHFAEYFLLEREAFVRTAYISYYKGVVSFLQSVSDLTFIRDPMEAMRYSLFLVAPAVVALLVAVLVRSRGEEKVRAAVVLAFSAAAFLTVFPRSDVWHVVFVSAMIAVGLVYVVDRLFRLPPVRNAICGAFFLCLGVGYAEALWASAVRVFILDYRFLELPHFQYAMAHPSEVEALKQLRQQLVAVANHGPLLLATHEAGFLYLITGIKNPTSIDYPMVASMGKHGEERMIKSLQTRQISFVCFRPYPDVRLRPLRLQTFIETQMQFVSELDFCTLYKVADNDSSKPTRPPLHPIPPPSGS
jgi:hypothetical protein